MFAVTLLPILLGVMVGWGGWLGLRGRLSRDRGAGVRTTVTLRSDEAFRLANKVAAVPTTAGGIVAVLGGVAGLLMPSTGGLVVATVLGLAGMIVLVTGGGVLGHRAARTVAAPEPTPSPCGTCSGAACLSGTMSTSCQAEETAGVSAGAEASGESRG